MRIEIESTFEMETDGLRGTTIFLDEASVMATENTVMAAVLTPGETTIGNAACEPHVQDLCRFLVSLGAEIEGIESNVLRIRGVESLRGGEWSIAPEHIEVGSFISTIGAFLIAFGVAIFLWNFFNSIILGKGKPAGDDPWEADTLEWATTSPPPAYNFPRIPVVHSARPLKEDVPHT